MKYIYFTLILCFLNIQELICDDRVLIQTPLCSQPSALNTTDYQEIYSRTMTNDQIEHSIQAWMYDGGLYKKESSGFTEKNDYLEEHRVQCMDIDADNSSNIFIGTDDGIFISTNTGTSWPDLTAKILGGKKIYCLSVNDVSGYIFAGTEQGIYKSTDGGNTWPTCSLSTQAVKCIILVGTDYLIATDKGIYKSTDNGFSWYRKDAAEESDPAPTTVLYYDNIRSPNAIYSGHTGELTKGIRKSTDGGNTWNQLTPNLPQNVSSICMVSDPTETSDNRIFVGTLNNGFFFFNTGSNTWVQVSGSYPVNQINQSKSPLNYLLYYSDDGVSYTLLGVTEAGLYNINPSPLTLNANSIWSPYQISTNDKVGYAVQIRMLGTDNSNNLWVASYGGEYYSDAVVKETDDNRSAWAENWPRFVCHGYAWHFSEGGTTGTNFRTPNTQKYIDRANEWNDNWDYIQVRSQDDWEKITYGGDSYSHSGIKIGPNRIRSKWVGGPLVEHNISSCKFYQNEADLKYWTAKKTITNEIINEDKFIGRHITINGACSVAANSNIKIYVAPMNNHGIHILSGFHAFSSCSLHVFVQTNKGVNNPPRTLSCNVPWEDIQPFPRITIPGDEDISSLLKNNRNSRKNPVMNLEISPNPSTDKISVLANIIDNKEKCPINISFFTINGKLVKKIEVINTIRSEIEIEDVNSGSYLVAAQADNVDSSGQSFSSSASQIIVIKK